MWSWRRLRHAWFKTITTSVPSPPVVACVPPATGFPASRFRTWFSSNGTIPLDLNPALRFSSLKCGNTWARSLKFTHKELRSQTVAELTHKELRSQPATELLDFGQPPTKLLCTRIYGTSATLPLTFTHKELRSQTVAELTHKELRSQPATELRDFGQSPTEIIAKRRDCENSHAAELFCWIIIIHKELRWHKHTSRYDKYANKGFCWIIFTLARTQAHTQSVNPITRFYSYYILVGHVTYTLEKKFFRCKTSKVFEITNGKSGKSGKSDDYSILLKSRSLLIEKRV